MLELATGFVSRHSGRPWSLITAAGALFLPVTLALFIEQPVRFERLGVTGVLLLSAATSLPFVLIATNIWHQLLRSTIRRAQLGRDTTNDEEMALAVQSDDPLEAAVLYAGAGTANIVLYAIALAAYFRDISLSRTYVNTGLSMLALYLAIAVIKTVLEVVKAAKEGSDDDEE